MTELMIEGMTCGHCSAAVKNALERVDGVTAADVDLATGRARVRGAVDPAVLIAAVQGEGYRASPLAP